MRLSSRLIERYVITAVLPYFALSLLLLTAMLLVQQATRMAEILDGMRTSLGLTADVLLGLTPNILLFTLPMSVVAGTATGFSRIGSDSELVALKAAGISNMRIVGPLLVLGLVMTALTLFNGLTLAPAAARLLRRAAARAALYKLESPIEPNAFNTDLPGKVIYVREGNLASGEWGHVFIHWQEEHEPTRIVTARTGRIDTSSTQSELVLGDAEVTTFQPTGAQGSSGTAQIVTEHSAQLRVRLNTGRDALMRRLAATPQDLDEMNWQELARASRQRQGAERRAVQLAQHKRLSLCCAPFALALLGAGLGLRVRRGGRGFGVLLSLACMLAYYLALLAGTQLGRTGRLPPQVGAWLATALAAAIGSGLLLLGERGISLRMFAWLRALLLAKDRESEQQAAGRRVRTHPWQFPILGLLDRSILRALAFNFATALVIFVGIFLIFTLFELLRYMNGPGQKMWLLVFRYLFFLIPLAANSIAPVGMLVAVLVTYALLARRSEAIAWWAAGQSAYRLALPCFIFAVAVGVGLWLMQEQLLPAANQRQEKLRVQIKGGTAQAVTSRGRQWLALPEVRRIYTYRYDTSTGTLEEPTVFAFDEEGIHVRSIVMGQRGAWAVPTQLRLEGAVALTLARGRVSAASGASHAPQPPEPITQEPFKPMLSKASELSTADLSNYIKALRAKEGGDLVNYELALARRRSDPAAPLVMAVIGLPLALAFGRRAVLSALSLAVGVGLSFWGSLSGFQQLGQYKMLPPSVAAWAPLFVFTAVGAYLLSRART